MVVLSKKDKEKLKNDIDKYKYLKILSFEEDFEQRKKLMLDDAQTSKLIGVLLLFIFIFLSYLINLELLKNIVAVLGLLLILGVVYYFIQNWNIKLVTKLKKFIFIAIPIEFWLIFSLLWLIPYFNDRKDIYSNSKLNLTVFALSTFFTVLQVCIVFKHFPNYLIDSLERIFFFLLTISSVFTLIYGPQILNPTSIGELVISWGVILTTGAMYFVQVWFKYKEFKKETIAQQIFQEQLLKNEDSIDYNRLVECYYYGGEKYKEKLLSTEKFLIEILKHELKLLKILDSYENYLLYKAFYSKILAASSIKLHRSETLAKSLKEK